MKKYEKLITDTNEKITALQKGSKKHSASVVQADLNALTRAIQKEDEAGAEKAAEKLTGGLKTIEIPAETETPNGKGKHGKN